MSGEFLAGVLDDPLVEEVIVLGGHRTFIVRDGVKVLLPEVVEHEEVRAFVERLLAGTGRRLDLASPIVSAQLSDGSRIHVTGPPVTHPGRLNVQIRRFVVAAGGLDRLVALGSVPPDVAALLAEAIRRNRTILVAGAPGAGKTTLINCLLAEVPPDQRVVTCEEVFEISVDLPDMTQMQTREEGLDGGGAITLRDLVRSSLRQRPDRIVVGEVRGPEALDLLLALNAGCSGLATLHANSAVDALDKVVGYCVLAGHNVVVEYVRDALASVTDLVVFLRRTPEGRRVDQVLEVDGWDGSAWRHQALYEAAR
ncbi:MAG: ATPase, T2SS/T4P/T4SS family [Actinomycetota bacterium]